MLFKKKTVLNPLVPLLENVKFVYIYYLLVHLLICFVAFDDKLSLFLLPNFIIFAADKKAGAFLDPVIVSSILHILAVTIPSFFFLMIYFTPKNGTLCNKAPLPSQCPPNFPTLNEQSDMAT